MDTLYATKLYLKPLGFKKQTFNVAITKTPELTAMPPNGDNFIMQFDYWRASRPTKRDKTIMYNCSRYNLQWLN